jgi:hypothetical protein
LTPEIFENTCTNFETGLTMIQDHFVLLRIIYGTLYSDFENFERRFKKKILKNLEIKKPQRLK